MTTRRPLVITSGVHGQMVDGDMLHGGAMPTFASVAALRASVAAEWSGVVHLLGHTTAGDAGAGFMRWDSGSSATDDTGLVINPTANAGAGRFRRLWDGHSAYAAWFGVLASAAAAANVTAITAAFAGASRVLMVPGTFSFNAAVAVPIGKTLECEAGDGADINYATSMTCILRSTVAMAATVTIGKSSRLVGLTVDANSVADVGISGTGAIGATIERCAVTYALKDGILVVASGNNNSWTQRDVFVGYCGRQYGTTAALALSGADITAGQKVTSAGTVSITAATATLAGSSTVWSTLGLRKGDPVCITSGAGTDWCAIETVNSDTSITLQTRMLPAFTHSAGADWSIGRGNGVNAPIFNDSNVHTVDKAVYRSNAGFGLRCAALCGWTLTGTQCDATGFAAIAVGEADGANPVLSMTVVHPYFEQQGVFDWWLGFPSGLHVVEPLAATTWAAQFARIRRPELRLQCNAQLTWRAGTFDMWTGSGELHGQNPPEGVETATVGSTFRQTFGGGLWTKITGSGNTGWRRVGGYEGTGSPEGAITAPVGSSYGRDDGGSGTTLYVKESGAGNTGWIAISSSTPAALPPTYWYF